MLVHGGRPGWARVGSFASITSALLLLGAGCGSRTSVLDVEAYASEGGGGFRNSGGSGNAGDRNAVDPQRSSPACARYCQGYKVKCSAELAGRDCMATCAGEVNGKGKDCQTLGIEVLDCLAPFFAPSSGSRTCQAAQNDGSVACQGQLGRFAQCAKPTTEPMPEPDPRPGQSGLVNGCDSAVSTAPDACIRYYTCKDGSYLVECVSQLDGRFSCSCSFPSGEMQGAIYSAGSDPCLRAGTDCDFY
jgi:hypothetical protein